MLIFSEIASQKTWIRFEESWEYAHRYLLPLKESKVGFNLSPTLKFISARSIMGGHDGQRAFGIFLPVQEKCYI